MARETKEPTDRVRRTVEWLKEKSFVDVVTDVQRFVTLGPEGTIALKNGLPERQIANMVKSNKGITIPLLRSKSKMSERQFNAALGRAKSLGLIEVKAGGKLLPGSTSDKRLPDEDFLESLASKEREIDELSADEKEAFGRLRNRPGLLELKEARQSLVRLVHLPPESFEEEKLETVITPSLIKQSLRRKIAFSKIDVLAPSKPVYPGREHPITRLVREVRNVWVSMGFEEIQGSLVQPSFWVFDALFTPQDHPARDMQDTLYVMGVRSKLNLEDIIDKVRATHENGWKTGSIGWRYKWSRKESERSVLRTHTTALSSRYLADNPDRESRIFSIGRVFRNESLDATHLFEFMQIEGVVSERGATARKLLGYMSEFYKGLGFEDVRFVPTYFPYTEPSFEPQVYSKQLKQWIELGGSGVFRPEVVRPLGVKNNVLAWGFGLERMALLRYGLKDIRDLYSNSLKWLRGVREYP